jgi:hypothetical protein
LAIANLSVFPLARPIMHSILLVMVSRRERGLLKQSEVISLCRYPPGCRRRADRASCVLAMAIEPAVGVAYLSNFNPTSSL